MKAERGFTLLEVMVALAVFATLAAAVLSATQWLARQSQQVEERVLATWVLDNRLQVLRLQASVAPAAAEHVESMGGRRWLITQRFAPVGDGALIAVHLSARAAPDGVQVHQLEGWLWGSP